MSHSHAKSDAPALQEPQHPGEGHENTDVSFRPLMIFLVVLVVVLILVMLLIKGQFSFYERGQSKGQVTPVPAALPPLESAPSDPKIQERPNQDMVEFRDEYEADLAELKWVDRSKGLARIPIEDAMALLVKKGLPARKAPAAPAAEATPKAAAPAATDTAPQGAAKEGS